MYKHLTQDQRYYIEVQLSNFISISKISKAIKVHPSTIYREIKRNSHYNGAYYSSMATGKASIRRYEANKFRKFDKFTNRVVNYGSVAL